MVLEVAILNILPGEESAFEQAIQTAEPLISATPGFGSIKLHRCIETPNRYLLLVTWACLEDHTVEFRQLARYEQWRKLLHRFYDPFPIVEHYGDSLVLRNST